MEQRKIQKSQEILIRKGYLNAQAINGDGLSLSENKSKLEYVFVENAPVQRIDVLGLKEYCGSAGNEQYVLELWFGGEGGPCDKHDDCYKTCGYGQEYCNGLFLVDMVKACPWFPPESTATCLAAAALYYAGVQSLGQTAFCTAQKGCCPKGEPLWGSCL